MQIIQLTTYSVHCLKVITFYEGADDLMRSNSYVTVFVIFSKTWPCQLESGVKTKLNSKTWSKP